MTLDIYQKKFEISIPKRFSDRVFLHVISHYLTDNYIFNPPMYLVIEGPPGEGKTYQTIVCCKQRGIEVNYISGSQLAGKNEGDSKQILDGYYRDAIESVKNGKYVSILIDDFHLSNAVNDENIKRTINSNILINYMMNLSSMYRVQIPIILTGNDFSKIYAPLIRDGRADLFHWEPTKEEKTLIVKDILAPFLGEYNDKKIDSFIKKYSEESIAFFSQLKHDIRLDIMLDLVSDVSILNKSVIKYLDSEIKTRTVNIPIYYLDQLANQRINSKKEVKKEGSRWF